MNVGIPFCREIQGIMNQSLSAYVEIYGSRVWIYLVDEMVPVVDQVLLQIPKPETVKLINGKRKREKTCSIQSQPAARCSLGWSCKLPAD